MLLLYNLGTDWARESRTALVRFGRARDGFVTPSNTYASLTEELDDVERIDVEMGDGDTYNMAHKVNMAAGGSAGLEMQDLEESKRR